MSSINFNIFSLISLSFMLTISIKKLLEIFLKYYSFYKIYMKDRNISTNIIKIIDIKMPAVRRLDQRLVLLYSPCYPILLHCTCILTA